MVATTVIIMGVRITNHYSYDPTCCDDPLRSSYSLSVRRFVSCTPLDGGNLALDVHRLHISIFPTICLCLLLTLFLSLLAMCPLRRDAMNPRGTRRGAKELPRSHIPDLSAFRLYSYPSCSCFQVGWPSAQLRRGETAQSEMHTTVVIRVQIVRAFVSVRAWNTGDETLQYRLSRLLGRGCLPRVEIPISSDNGVRGKRLSKPVTQTQRFRNSD